MTENIKKYLATIPDSGIDESSDLSPVSCARPVSLRRTERRDPKNIKRFIAEMMHFHSSMKYPNPPWEYQRLESNGQEIIHIRYHPDQRREDESYDTIQKQTTNAIALRKLSILGGLLTGLEAEGYLGIPEEIKPWLIERLYQMAENIYAEPLLEGENPEDVISQFHTSLALLIRTGAGDPGNSFIPPLAPQINLPGPLDKITRDPNKELLDEMKHPEGAEFWFLSEYSQNQRRVFEIVNANESQFQTDIPFGNSPHNLIPAYDFDPDRPFDDCFQQLLALNNTPSIKAKPVLISQYGIEEGQGLREIRACERDLALDQNRVVHGTHHILGSGFFPKSTSFTVTEKFNTETNKIEHHFQYTNTFQNLPADKLLLVAATRVKEFQAVSRHPEAGIEIFGSVDPRLCRAMEAYCQLNSIPCRVNNPLMHSHATEESRHEMRDFLKTKEARLAGLSQARDDLPVPVNNTTPRLRAGLSEE